MNESNQPNQLIDPITHPINRTITNIKRSTSNEEGRGGRGERGEIGEAIFVTHHHSIDAERSAILEMVGARGALIAITIVIASIDNSLIS